MQKKYTTILTTVALLSALPHLFADTVGLIGGSAGNFVELTPYGALVSEDGSVTLLNGLPEGGGFINTVAINGSGNGLIGGVANNGAFYGALVSADGSVKTLAGLSGGLGIINSVAINSSGNGLIGGAANSGACYGAVVSANGSATLLDNLPEGGGIINTVAINSSGNGLIGGSANGGALYGAVVSADGLVTPLTDLTGVGGLISVAINDSGNGLIGGSANGGALYGAVVSANGSVTRLTDLPGDGGLINSVAINGSGNGLIGGAANGGALYGALVSANGSVTPLTNLPEGGGVINTVAINDSGNGLIGGSANGGLFYGALVSAKGSVTPLNGLPEGGGRITSVAINDSGNGLIGGAANLGLTPYAALVSANGSVTPLTGLPVGGGVINSVAMLSLLSRIPTDGLHLNNKRLARYLNAYSPDTAFYFVPALLDGSLSSSLEAAAPTRHAFDLFTVDHNLFFLMSSFTQHADAMRHYRFFEERLCQNSHGGERTGYYKKTKRSEKPHVACELGKKPYQIWTKIVGDKSTQPAQHQVPSFQPWTAGVMVGLDVHASPHVAYGVGAAYTFSGSHQAQNFGHSRIQQEYLFAYGVWHKSHFYAQMALWGGLFQISNVRNINMTAFQFQSTSHPNGWQIAPHAEVGYRNSYKIATFEPFIGFDWALNRQSSYQERGEGPLIFGQRASYSSFLRSEGGLKVYETIPFSSWRLVFQEKISYVNQQLFNVDKVRAYLVGAEGSFTVDTFMNPQSLAVAAAQILFEPIDPSYPYGSVAYQGEFGLGSNRAGGQSHQLSLHLGWNF